MAECDLDLYSDLLLQTDTASPRDADISDSSNTLTTSPINHNSFFKIDTTTLISDFREQLERLERNADLALCWLFRERTLRRCDCEESIMRTILTAGGCYDWERVQILYRQVQRMMDLLVLGRSKEAEDTFTLAQESDLMMIEHVSVIAFEASLQAVKLLGLASYSKDSAAGDLIVLIVLASGRLPGGSLKKLELQLQDVAAARLDELLAGLMQRVEMMKRDAESGITRSISSGSADLFGPENDMIAAVPNIIRIFSDSIDRRIRERLLLLHPMYQRASEDGGQNSNTMYQRLNDALIKGVSSDEVNWQCRQLSLAKAHTILKNFTERYTQVEYDLTCSLNQVLSWLCGELEVDVTWVNAQREGCRHLAVSICLLMLTMIDTAGIVRHLDSAPCERLVMLIARTWALEISKPISVATRSPRSGSDTSKKVDASEEKECIPWLDLLCKLATVLTSGVSSIGKYRKLAMIVDDYLDQALCAMLRRNTFGLPLFLEECVGDMDRVSLRKRRELAQHCFSMTGLTDSRENMMPDYREVYRPLRENAHFSPCIMKTMMRTEFRLSREDTYGCKLLSYVVDDVMADLVLQSCIDSLNDQVRFRREALINWLARTYAGVASTDCLIFATEHCEQPSLEAPSLLHGIVRAIELCLRTHLTLIPSAELCSQMQTYMLELGRLNFELRRVASSAPEFTKPYQKRFEALADLTVSLISDVWVPRCINRIDRKEHATCVDECCLLCVACDWLEQCSHLDGGDVEDDQQSGSSTDNGKDAIDDASSATSLTEFIDKDYVDEFRNSESTKRYETTRLRKDLYVLVKSYFWDDRMIH